jgi:hypothetical protein
VHAPAPCQERKELGTPEVFMTYNGPQSGGPPADVNRTINEGKQYTDSDTGNNVSVRGNRVVITNEDGDVVSQFKNTRANTQQRIDDGKWVPKPEPESK